jgi:hypothetical protein
MERTSIPCNQKTRDELKKLKEKRGEDWDTLLLNLADRTDSEPDNSNEFNTDGLAREVSRELDYTELANQVADELSVRCNRPK